MKSNDEIESDSQTGDHLATQCKELTWQNENMFELAAAKTCGRQLNVVNMSAQNTTE